MGEIMNYEETLAWMFEQIPMYQRTGKAAYKVDLELTHKIDQHLGFPHTSFKSVHVAGTNGKGSVSHILASVLQTAGYKTGLYTSPHLKDFRERIRVNGTMVEEQFVVEFIDQYKDFFLDVQPSFFEMTVAMAFDYFRKQQVDIAVIEVGMGGRLDSTNIIQPKVTAITNIGLDHTQYLGNTIEEIAKEKGGTIKQNTPVVIGETAEKTEPLFREIAKEKEAPIKFADQEFVIQNREVVDEVFHQYDISNSKGSYLEGLQTDLMGSYQAKNILTALQVLENMKQKGYRVEEEHIRNGLKHVCENTGFRGRWFVLSRKPLIVCDTAHNREGLQYVMEQLNSMKAEKIHFVLGFVSDKNLDNVMDLFPKRGQYYFTKADIPRALDEGVLAEIAGKYNLKGQTFAKVTMALEAAKKNASASDMIYVGGSTFIVSEVI